MDAMKNLRPWCAVAGLTFLTAVARAQEPVTITGHVSAGGQPVQGAAIQIRELGVATVTNADGRFTFIVPSSKVRGQSVNLTARHVRYNPESFALALTGGMLVHDFELFPVGDSRSSVVADASRQSGAQPVSRSRTRDPALTSVVLDSTAFDELAGPQDFVSALAGRVVGLDVTSAGSLGGSALAVLRGYHSILGTNQPLFVLDGIPIENTSFSMPGQPFGSGGFDYGRPIQDIEPSEIATIQVLRGPAAARFGGRGANGVILITTRSGRGLSGFEVSASQNYSTESLLRLPSFQNAYGQGLNGKYSFFDGVGGGTNDGVAENWGPALQGQAVTQASLISSRVGDVRPWLARPGDVAAFFNGGSTLTTSAAAQQANDHESFRISLHRRASTGVVPTNTLTRQGASLSADDQLTAALGVSATVDLTSDVARNRPAGGSDASNTIGDFARMGRQVDLAALKANAKNGDDQQINWIYTSINNPFFAIQDNSNRDDRTRVIGGGSATYTLNPELKATARVGTDHYTQSRNFDVGPAWMGGFPFYAGRGDFSSGGFQRQTITASETNAALELLDDVVTPRAGMSAGLTISGGVDHRSNSLRIDSRGSDQRPDTGTGPTTPPSIVTGDNSTTGVYATADWNANDYTRVLASARNEWYSILSSGSNSALYPAISASVDLARAGGVRGDKLTSAIVHAGWSRSGGEVSPLLLHSIFVPTDSGASTISASPTLRPEITNALEAGVSLSFLRNRLALGLTVYDEQTSDVILGLSSGSGQGIVASNVASLSNKGVEVQASIVPIRTAGGADWRIDGHIAKNANSVDDLLGGATAIPLGPSIDGLTLEARKGSALGALVGTAFKRDASGAVVLQNGAPVSDGQQHVLGTMAPSWSGAVGSTVHVGRIDASALVDARIGGSIFSTTNFAGLTTGTFAETANRPDSGQVYAGVDAATGKPNTIRATTEAYYHALAPIQEAWVYDASFVKLRDVRLSIVWPLRGFTPLAAQSVRVSLIGRNLAMWSKAPNIDPETALSTTSFQGIELGQLPAIRSVGLQISLTP
jgi:TonB-dependent SusC/RagA subfamily outer membrane receptor